MFRLRRHSPVSSHCLAAALVGACCFLLLPGPVPADEREEAEAELAAVETAISEIRQWLNSAERELDAEETALREITDRLRRNEQRIAENRTAIADTEAERETLQQQEQHLEARLLEQEAVVASALRASWISGNDSLLKVLLNQQDPGVAPRMLRYYQDFNQSRLEQIRLYQQDLQALSDTREAIAQRSEQLGQSNQQLQAQLESLAEDRAAQEQAITDLQTAMSGRDRELEELMADREALQALIEEIRRIVIDIPAAEDLAPISEARGELPWPLQGPVLSAFGARYSDGNMVRQGLIIGAEEGSPVRAVHHGRVVFADWLRGSGLLVVVDHGEGYISLYARNASLNKEAGEWVNRGEPVGTAGSDAGTGSPGLYFEIRHNGQALDPVNWFVPR